MKSLKLHDIVWADGYKATVYLLPNLDGDMQIILDEGLWTETIYDCNIHDITYDSYRDWETDRKSTRLNSSHITRSRMPSSA